LARAGLALLVAAATVACGPAGGATAPPPVAPPMPEEAKKGDSQGATSFASHWLDLVDYAHQTRDAGPLRGLGLPSCLTCAQFITQLDSDRAAGARYEGGRIHFHSAEPSDVEDAGHARVDVVFDEDELRVFDSSGRQVDTVPAGRTVFVFDLRWTEGAWRAASIKLGVEDSTAPTPAPGR
jgi:Family of unknown function (DUF6318)